MNDTLSRPPWRRPLLAAAAIAAGVGCDTLVALSPPAIGAGVAIGLAIAWCWWLDSRI